MILIHTAHLPITEFTFFDVFFPNAQMQAHSAGTVKLARDHWLSTYWPITGPTFPTRANLGQTVTSKTRKTPDTRTSSLYVEGALLYHKVGDEEPFTAVFKSDL